ncbi:PepSY domain-containing protein [Anaerobacillus sp. CMMVII]|uniref:PepSY domain-containing protein n=1 Tax=Anaerobacillus sp. CMMVII TaxID=2755588 RepID=UPI0021B7E6E2|nr:PepSY domain-containing protein [Anaerobacillus sp. CMMVII]MCT8136610.1 PepSY domain-containing protein [Anaerobacillus sp. CMMVII]
MRLKNKRFFIGLITFFMLFLLLFIFFLFINQDTTLATEEEIVAIVQSQYEGSTVQSVIQKKSEFTIVIDHSLGEYELVINGQTREITALRLLNLHDIESPKDEQGKGQIAILLTEQEAIDIALQEVSGKLDEIELELEDGIMVYEVEIEVDDQTEVTIIINAYTGKVLSVTWD